MRKIVVGMRKMKNWKWECGKLEWKRKNARNQGVNALICNLPKKVRIKERKIIHKNCAFGNAENVTLWTE